MLLSHRGLLVQTGPREPIWLVDDGEPPVEVHWIPPEHEALLPVGDLQATIILDAALMCPGLSDRARRQLREYAASINGEPV